MADTPTGPTPDEVSRADQLLARATELAGKQTQIKQLTGEITDDLQAQADLRRGINDEMQKSLAIAADIKVNGDQRSVQLQEALDALEKESVLKKVELGADKAAWAKAEKDFKKKQKYLADELKERKEATELVSDLTDEEFRALRTRVTGFAEATTAANKYADASENLTGYAEDTASAVTGIGNAYEKSLLGATLLTAKEEGMGAALDKIGKGLKKAFTADNIAGSLLARVSQQTLMLALATDQAQSSFSHATGAGDEYREVISSVYEANLINGVSIDESAQAVQGLMESFSGFGAMAKGAQKEWAGMAATLAEVGVSAQDAGQLFEYATKVMGKSQEQTAELMGDLSALASELGVSYGALAGQFNSAMKDLAVFGDKAPQVFAELAAAAQVTGIEIGSLVSNMKEMDTIEGAAKRAGELNAVLQGRFLDTHELLNASYSERILLVKKALVQSGKDWNSMGRAERQMIQNTLGVSSADEAAKLMNTSLTELSSKMRDAANASGSFSMVADKAGAAQSVTERWGQVMESLAIAVEPLLTILGGFADSVAFLMRINIGGFYFVKWLVVLTALFWFLGGPLKAATTAVKDFGKSIADGAKMVWKHITAIWADIKARWISTAATKSQTVAIKAETVSENLSTTSKNIGFIASMRLAGAKAWSVIKTIALVGWELVLRLGRILMIPVTWAMALATAFLAKSQLASAVTAIPAAAGTTAMGTAAWYAVIPIGLIAIGMGLMALGIGLVAIAIAAIILGFIELIKLLVESPGAALQAAGGIALLGLSFLVLAFGLGILTWVAFGAVPALMALGVGMMFLALGLGGVAAALAIVPIAALANFFALIETINSVTLGTVFVMYELASAIDDVGGALADLNPFQAMVFTMMLQSVGDVSKQAVKLTPAAVKNVEDLTVAAQEYSNIKWGGLFLNPFDNPMINLLKSAVGAGAGAGGAGGPGGLGGAGGPGAAVGGRTTTVILELDGKQLGKTVEAVLDKRNKLKTAVT